MLRNIIVSAVILVGVAMLSLVGPRLAVSSTTSDGASDPPSASLTADKTAGSPEAGKTDQGSPPSRRPALSAIRSLARWARRSR